MLFNITIIVFVKTLLKVLNNFYLFFLLFLLISLRQYELKRKETLKNRFVIPGILERNSFVK